MGMEIEIKASYSIFGTIMGYWGYIDGKYVFGSYGFSPSEFLKNTKKALKKYGL
jgi:hypothetical protein